VVYFDAQVNDVILFGEKFFVVDTVHAFGWGSAI